MRDVGALVANTKTEVSGAPGIQGRILGKARHVQVSHVWIQDRLEEGEGTFKTIPGSSHHVDGF